MEKFTFSQLLSGEAEEKQPAHKRVTPHPEYGKACRAYGDMGQIMGESEKHYDVKFDNTGITESVPKFRVVVL